MAETTVPSRTDQPAIASYNAMVVAYFVLGMAGQVALAQQYIRLLPAELQGFLRGVVILGYGVQSALFIAVIPLSMVFIFGWLYLSDIHVKVRPLYQVVVVALIPLMLFTASAYVYLLTARGLAPDTRQKMQSISAALQSEMSTSNDPSKLNPVHLQQLAELLKEDITRRWSPINRLIPIPLGLTCLTCAWMLHRKLGVGPVRSVLIPVAFSVSVGLVRWATAAPSQHLLEKLKTITSP